jgi:hypothetical protein
VEYKYVTSRNLVFNHALGSNWEGMGTETVGPFHYYYDICPDIQQNQLRENTPTRRRCKCPKKIYRREITDQNIEELLPLVRIWALLVRG